MAQINISDIIELEKNRNTIHDKVYTTYTVFEENGEKYVQFDTYGRDSRDNPGKISQSLQIDYEAAKFIVKLLTKEFEL